MQGQPDSRGSDACDAPLGVDGPSVGSDSAGHSEPTAYSRKASLSSKAIRSGFWMVGLKTVTYIILAVKLLIVARFLSPSDLGLIGIVLLVTTLFESMSEMGGDIALARKQGSIETLLNTAWVLSIVRGAFLAATLFLTAPLIASFFDSVEAIPLLRAASLLFVIRGFVNSATVYFVREMDFRKQFFFNITDTLATAGIAISASILMQNAWALVFGAIAGALARLGASFLFHSRRPSFRIDRDAAREIFAFGRWVWANNVMVFLGNKFDCAIIGKILGTTTLGIYQMAYKVSSYTRDLSESISQVAFPVYSRLHDDPERRKNSFLATSTVSFSLGFPITLLFIFFAEDFVRLFLGARWLESAQPMRFLAISFLFRSMANLGAWLIYAAGLPKLNFVIVATRTASMCVFLFPFTFTHGVNGASFAVLLSNAISLIPLAMFVKKIGVSVSEYVSNMMLPVALGAVTFGFAFFAWRIVRDVQTFWIVLPVLAGASVYLTCLAFLRKDLVQRIQRAYKGA